MKTPEELKESLDACFEKKSCATCHYAHSIEGGLCLADMGLDAKAYIEQLEEQIDLMKIQMHGDCGVCKHRQEGRAGYDIKAHKFHMPDHCTGCQTSNDRPNWEYEGLPEVKGK